MMLCNSRFDLMRSFILKNIRLETAAEIIIFLRSFVRDERRERMRVEK